MGTAVVLCLFPGTVRSQDLVTTIDIGYTRSHAVEGEDITNKRELVQKYQVVYNSSLGYFYDFSAGMSVEYGVSKATGTATTRKLSPTIDLKLKSDTLDFALSYAGSKNETEATIDTDATVSYSNGLILDLGVKPRSILPEAKLKWEIKQDYEEYAVDRLNMNMELDLKYALEDFGSTFKLTNTRNRDYLPSAIYSTETTWELAMDYGRKFSDLFDMQLDYLIQESLLEDYAGTGDTFVSSDSEYTQNFKASLKSNFEIPRNFVTNLGYDLEFEQDFLEAEFDRKVNQKVAAGIKRDFFRWASLNVRYEGSDEKTYGAGTDEDQEKVKNKGTATLTLKPTTWLNMESRAEKEYTTEIKPESGDSVTGKEINRHETTLTMNLGQTSKFTTTYGYEEELNDGLLVKTAGKFKSQLQMKFWDVLQIDPSYSANVETVYEIDPGYSLLDAVTRDWNAELKLTFEKEWLKLVMLRAEHTFGYKYTEELDAIMSLSDSTELTEDTRVVLRFTNFVQGLAVELEYGRKAGDTIDDEEPMIVDLVYSLKVDWAVSEFTVASTYKYEDKGDTDDTISFNFKLGWKRELLEITGEYQYEETLAEELTNSNQYNVKMKFVF